MYVPSDRVYETSFDTFSFDKQFVFGMFVQIYNSILRQEERSARLEEKFDRLLSQYRGDDGYGKANIEELCFNSQAVPVVPSGSALRFLGGSGGFGGSKINGVDSGNETVNTVDMDSPNGLVLTDLKKGGTRQNLCYTNSGGPPEFPAGQKSMDDEELDSRRKQDGSLENKHFIIQGAQLYLTYSQSKTLTREAVISKVSEEFGSIRQYVVAQEVHKDGNPHIHGYFKMAKKVYRKGIPRWLDIDGIHPNIETDIRNPGCVIRYCSKDKDYIAYGIDIENYLNGGRQRSGVRMQVCVDVLDNGKTAREVVESYKTPLVGLSGLVRDIELYNSMRVEADTIHNPLREFMIAGLPFVFEGRPKEKQFWIVGPTNTGKTTIIESFMKEGYIGFALPTDNWWEGWHNKVGYVYAKEFHGGIPLYVLNEFLEGGAAMKLKIKNGQLWKKINVPCLIESNQYPHEVYANVPRGRIDALSSRLNIIVLSAHDNGDKGYSSARVMSELEYSRMLDCKGII